MGYCGFLYGFSSFFFFFFFWNFIVRIHNKLQKKCTCFVFVYNTFFMNLLSFGVRSGNIFYWVIPVNVFFHNIRVWYLYIYIYSYIRKYTKLYGNIGEAKSVLLKLLFNFLHRNYHCQANLVKKFYIYYQKKKSCNSDGVLFLPQKKMHCNRPHGFCCAEKIEHILLGHKNIIIKKKNVYNNIIKSNREEIVYSLLDLLIEVSRTFIYVSCMCIYTLYLLGLSNLKLFFYIFCHS